MKPKKKTRPPKTKRPALKREPFTSTLVTKGISAPVTHTFPTKAAALDGPRLWRFTASTAEVDRQGDRILPTAWKLDAYKKNPVIFFAHATTGLPIGKAHNVWVDGRGLQVDVEFLPRGMYELADTVQDMVANGYLNAVSVGFRPGGPRTKNEFGGVDFGYPCDLCEISVVGVPANASARLHGRAAKDAIEKWLRAPKQHVVFRLRDEPIVLRLRDDPTPAPRYQINQQALAAALAQSLGAALTNPTFRRELQATVASRVDVAMRRLRGKLD